METGSGPIPSPWGHSPFQPRDSRPHLTAMPKLLLALTALACLPCAAQELRVEEIRFTSHDTTLAGSLVLPPGDVRAAVVYVHGSGPQERNLHLARQFAAAGIAALVYDKRGAGKSGGEYEGNQSVSQKNLELLADDASAALRRLAAHPAARGKPLGFTGLSQAGWIVPLAAKRNELTKFVVLWSGPVCKVSEEDIYSKHTGDKDAGVAPPYAEALKARQVKYVWPDFLGRDTDSAEDIASLAIPGLWIFSDDDSSIPVDLSLDKLRALREKGRPFDYALFSGLGHDNVDATFSFAASWIARAVKP